MGWLTKQDIHYETLVDGVPDYTEQELHKVSMIRDLLEAGMRVDAVQEYLQFLCKKTQAKRSRMCVNYSGQLFLGKMVQRCPEKEERGQSSIVQYSMDIKKLDDGLIQIKFGVTLQVGAHNPIGYDELTYTINSSGKKQFTDYL